MINVMYEFALRKTAHEINRKKTSLYAHRGWLNWVQGMLIDNIIIAIYCLIDEELKRGTSRYIDNELLQFGYLIGY